MQPYLHRLLIANVFCTILLWPPARCDSDEDDPTKQLLKQLNLSMVEVIDEKTVLMRHTTKKSRNREVHIRLGNTGSPLQGSLDDTEYAAKLDASKAALKELCDKTAVWYKFAPEALQPPSSTDGSPDIVLADLWTKGGKHVNSAMKKGGHLIDVEEYEPIARDIFAAANAEVKDESYKKLAEAIKESETARLEAAKKAKKEAEAEEEEPEPFGLTGIIAIAGLVALGIGAATNFGKKPKKSSKSMNRKGGFFEQFFARSKASQQ
jgi:hypothetical protein